MMEKKPNVKMREVADYVACKEPGDFYYKGLIGDSWSPVTKANGIPPVFICFRNNHGEFLQLPISHPTKEDKSWHWDGNWENPTVQPSIWRNKPTGWHGFIRNGEVGFDC